MTLSRWIRDYIYIPLGGSRGSKFSACANLLVTMGLAGLWHGASWNFVVWGLYHGLGLVIHHRFEESRLRNAFCQRVPTRLYQGIMILLTFHFVIFGWLLFRAPNFSTAWAIYAKFAQRTAAIFPLDPAYLLKSYGFTSLLLYGLYILAGKFRSANTVIADVPRRRMILYIVVVMVILVLTPLHTDPFIYFRF